MASKRKRPKTFEAEHAGRKVRVTVPGNEPETGGAEDVGNRIRKHPMYSPTDLKYLRKKGYSDEEILAFWDRDHGLGCKPVEHRSTYAGSPREVVQEVMRDNLSPQAVAAIAAHLHGLVNTKDEKVNGEVVWFAEQLLEMLGDQYNALCEEIGL